MKGMGIPWETALGAVFLSGVAFMILTFAGVRQLIVEAIPKDLYAAVASGIGLFIALIRFAQRGRLLVASPATAGHHRKSARQEHVGRDLPVYC